MDNNEGSLESSGTSSCRTLSESSSPYSLRRKYGTHNCTIAGTIKIDLPYRSARLLSGRKLRLKDRAADPPRPWNIFVKQTSEFCHETGLHGCKYICETQRSTIERIAWAITVLASLCIATGMLKVTYDYYHKHSILSVIETTHHGIWNYPFPAVTICDFNRVSLKLTKKFVENLTLPMTVSKEFMVQEMKLLDELLYPGIHGSYVRNNLSRLQIVFDMNELSIPTIMNSVTRSCENLLEACKWKAKTKDCSAIFRPSLSRDGLCCSFNYITYDKIVEESKYI
ncbi:PREDICTED: sodium channel protein Nach-like [Eufriesea mexicana]|uniref:sodium channel protein Nach-like n=1 Tax=Eufriesea mexicana TaxID=516756 RepID=UPI00083C3D6B|nr:PREDICTED: sodium channel protein Nach-like [Eufriesea mexicana]